MFTNICKSFHLTKPRISEKTCCQTETSSILCTYLRNHFCAFGPIHKQSMKYHIRTYSRRIIGGSKFSFQVAYHNFDWICCYRWRGQKRLQREDAVDRRVITGEKWIRRQFDNSNVVSMRFTWVNWKFKWAIMLARQCCPYGLPSSMV